MQNGNNSTPSNNRYTPPDLMPSINGHSNLKSSLSQAETRSNEENDFFAANGGGGGSETTNGADDERVVNEDDEDEFENETEELPNEDDAKAGIRRLRPSPIYRPAQRVTTTTTTTTVVTPNSQTKRTTVSAQTGTINRTSSYSHLPAAINRNSPMNISNSTTANTYCELCNARFSSVDSYAAHMRNCHPRHHLNAVVSSNGEHSNKMPYLTSILSTPTNMSPKSALTAKSINGPGRTPVCTIPGCNCSSDVSLATIHHYPVSAPTAAVVAPPVSSAFDMDHYIHKEQYYTCVQCNISSLNQAGYMQHIKQTHCVEVYRCILCKQMQLFDNPSLLKEHFFQVHAAHKYDVIKCKVCPPASSVTFAGLDELAQHVKCMHGRDRFPPPAPQSQQPATIHLNGHHLPAQPPPAPPVTQPPPSHLLNNDRFLFFSLFTLSHILY